MPPSNSTTIHQELKHRIQKATADDVDAHKNIYSYFSSQYSRLSQSESVPVFHLAYSARRILYPSPVLLEHTPRLLKVLTEIDKERKRFVGIAEQVITWQNFYKADRTSKGKCVLLEEGEEKCVNKIRSEKKAGLHRFAYTQLAIRWCKLYIYNLYVTDETALLKPRLLEFYPGLRRGQPPSNSAEKHAFHHDFDTAELERLEAAQKDSVTFITQANEWRHNRKKYWEQNEFPMDRFFVDDDFTSYKAELTRQFEPPCDVEELVRNTETYLQKVETMAQTFENLFGEPVHKEEPDV